MKKAIEQKEKNDERANEKQVKIYYNLQRRRGWGNDLHKLLKIHRTLPVAMYQAPYWGQVPSPCIWNQKVAALRLKFKREGKNLRLVIPCIVIPWAQYMYSMIPPIE